ncbi:hypothetical protein [Paenibacillus popilliae]|uniref:Ribosomal protein L13 n=1 Tax=Paenibacillus popilliae ATCC 14706 TaxID=1212764 RepID=M9LBZ4_PAEPP|nr:hypothetical protein [Paenibacillus popilliae]GAC43497.1 ribosomal protein L13 [Paenibacillus popilliae ATCC 14706]
MTTEGESWQEHGITSDRVLARIGGIKEGSQQLGRFAEKLVQQAVERGYLAK